MQDKTVRNPNKILRTIHFDWELYVITYRLLGIAWKLRNTGKLSRPESGWLA
jgi:hypothetical protein